MAGNKINSKSKGNQYKATKNTHNENDVYENLDFTELRKPVQTSITGLEKVIKVLDTGTEELKGMLLRECDVIYECKVCRSIFRSLLNFVSHKRMFCTEEFNSFKHSHFTKDNDNDIKKITIIEKDYQESLTTRRNDVENDDEDRIPLTKNMTAVVEAITKTKGINIDSECEMMSQKIPDTAVAAYQSVNYDAEEKLENMHKQVEELNNILSMDKVVLKSGGKCKIQSSVDEADTATDSVIQISDDDDEVNMLKCKICNMQFSTQKTFRFHMKCKHVETRLVYPCPDCMEIFSTSWSVFRHLFKVHRKSAAQVRRLRESIQSKAFKINNPPAFYEKRKNMNLKVAALKKSSQEKLEHENQEWMDSMESDNGVPRCGGCGRHFERRAALSAHMNTCQPRARAINRRPDAKKIEIQIRKDYNKGPAAPFRLLTKPPDATDKTPVEDIGKVEPQEITVDNKESEKIENMPKQNSVEKTTEPTYLDDAKMGVIESDGKETRPVDVTDVIENDAKEPAIIENETKSNRTFSLPFAQLSERSNTTAFKQKVEADIDNLLCRRCDEEFCDTDKLYEHMAGHYGWMRYACKLCNFKHYLIDKLIEHVKVVHKLKGDVDFYGSTIKALDGLEALELMVELNEINDSNKTSPDSRRPSRCSSDSSRLSDDSCSSNTRVETVNKKRKIYSNKNIRIKKNKREERKEVVLAGDSEKDDNFDTAIDPLLIDNESSNSKTWEENSSDKDDVEEKGTIDQNQKPYGATSRRPVRNKIKPRNKDFEYDLSNLLKTDAQAYKDFQFTMTAKTNMNKRKPQSDNQINNNPVIITNSIKDCSGALMALSKKATDIAAAHMKVQTYALYNKRKEQINQFIKPPLPKISRNEKMPPNKTIEDVSKCTTPEKSRENNRINGTDNDINDNQSKEIASKDNDEQKKPPSTVKPLPIKFSRESLEVIRNPLINQKFNEFSKAGMKTKILVIKPINRNKDSNVSKPLKFQTIKIKDPRRLSNEDRSSDQIVVLKFPKTDSKVAQQTEKCNNTNKDKPTDVSNQTVEIDCNSKTDEENKNNANVNNFEKINDKSTNNCKENESVATAGVVDNTDVDLKCSETL